MSTFVGKPCRQCGACERYASRGHRCVRCTRQRALERWRKPEVRQRYREADKRRWKTQKRKEWMVRWRKTEKSQTYIRAYWKTEKAAEQRKRWRRTPNGRAAKSRRHKVRMLTDIQYALGYRLRNRLMRALKRGSASGRALSLLGCSVAYLKVHLERQFGKGMTWKNMGRGGWHIDHILPISSFDLTDARQLAEAFNYKNLQPLWAEDNLAKKAQHPVAFAQANGLLL